MDEIGQRIDAADLADDLRTVLPIGKHAGEVERHGARRISVDPAHVRQVGQRGRRQPCAPADRTADPDGQVGQAQRGQLGDRRLPQDPAGEVPTQMDLPGDLVAGARMETNRQLRISAPHGLQHPRDAPGRHIAVHSQVKMPGCR